jgi:chaperone modulatory protein CbpM
MRIELTDMVWLEEHELSFAELTELSGLPAELLNELIESGGIEPVDRAAAERRYGAPALAAARQARRLREDFELDSSALLVVLGLLERVRELEARVTELQAKLPRRLV